MKSNLMEIIKHNIFLHDVYGAFGKFGINIIKCFVRTDEKLILFNSFGGKKYDDSSRVIYELMSQDERFKGYNLVWAFHEPEKFPEIKNKIKTDNLQYFMVALKARCWVTNSAVQRGIDFTGKNTLKFNTWHGTPIKKMGSANKGQKVNDKVVKSYDVILAQGRYEAEKMSEAFGVPMSKFKLFGYPRNDILANISDNNRYEVRHRLNIKDNQRVILYAPTFRDYELDEKSHCSMKIPIDYDYWDKKFGDDTVFLIRMHYEVAKHTKLPNSDNWVECSDYPSLNDLMMASDILISDYSSILFDYSILGKPMFIFAYDYDTYQEKRGLYFDVREQLTWADNSRDLADKIVNSNISVETKRAELFRKHYVEHYGNAAQKSVDCIYSYLNNSRSETRRK